MLGKGGGTYLKVKVQIIYERKEQKFFLTGVSKIVTLG